MSTIVIQIQGSSRDTFDQAKALLENVPGVRRVLLDPVDGALVVRGSVRPAELRRLLSEAGIKSTIVSSGRLGPSLFPMDHTVVAAMILVGQLALLKWSFGVHWDLAFAAQAGASLVVMVFLGFPLIRVSATCLLKKIISIELVIVFGAICAWVAGALSAVRLEDASQPYSVLSTISIVSGLFARSVVNISRAGASERLRRILHLAPERATIETRNGTKEVPAKRLRAGRIVRVGSGRRFPLDGVILSGVGDVDEGVVAGGEALYSCGPGDAVLAGSVNLGEPRRVEATSSQRGSAVSQLATLAIGAGSKRPMAKNRYHRIVMAVFAALLVVAVVVVAAKWLRVENHLALIETGFLIVALGAPASFIVAAPFIYVLTIAMLRRWGIWVRDPAAVESAVSIRLLAIVSPGILSEGEKRVLKTFATSGDERRVLAFANAVLAGSNHAWESKVHNASMRANAEPFAQQRLELTEDIGLIGYVNDGVRTSRVAIGTGEFMARVGVSINPNFIETKLADIPDATAVFVAIDSHIAGTIWMTDRLRQTAHGAVRSIRARGLETCLVGDEDPAVLKQQASLIGVDSFLPAKGSDELIAQIEGLRAKDGGVAVVGHSVDDAAGLATADLGIGFGELTSPASARPGFLLRHRDPLLVSSCFLAARAVRRRIWQSMALASLPALAAIGMSIAGTISLKTALAFTAAGLLLVAGNSARMLFWRPRFRLAKR
jgi:Cu+-exporting ATPase